MIFLDNINLSTNELQNAVVQPLTTAPANPKVGQIYYNSVSKKLMQFDGSDWMTVGMVVNDTTAGDGIITVDGVNMTVYTLPIATATTLGGIRIGTGLNIDAATGTVSVSGGASVESANKLTTARTISLSGEASGSVSFDGSKDVDIAVTLVGQPTKLSEFENDEGFIKSTVDNLVNYWTATKTQQEINTAIAGIATIQIQVVEQLPETGKSNIIYLISNSGTGQNIYDEYLWTGTAFEKIGTTAIDLSNYLQKDGDASEVTSTYSTYSASSAPASGSKLKEYISYVMTKIGALSTVATSGSYNDLSNRPDLVKHLDITIQPSALSASSAAGFFANKTILNVISFLQTSASKKELVQVDVDLSNNTMTTSIAQANSHAVVTTVSYI